MMKTQGQIGTSAPLAPKSTEVVKKIKRATKNKKKSATASAKVGTVALEKVSKKKHAPENSDGKQKKKKKKKLPIAIKTKLPAPASKETEKKPRRSPEKLGIVTRAGIRRCATRVGIRCIQRATVTEVRDVVESLVGELLMRARSNAYNISKTKTLRMADVASAARNMGLGDVIV